MGIGIWYEMWISDPVAYLFKNTDPRGSLRANVSNATVRCLSNMQLAEMLETRHNMSQTVRAEVSAKSQAWGYQLGSVYIRKVHFRDAGMIRQIEEKVVNRLRQVTSAIRQAGANQVSVITSSAEREAAIEFAKAAAIRPATLGDRLPGNFARSRSGGHAVRDSGNAADVGQQRATGASAGRSARAYAGEPDGGGGPWSAGRRQACGRPLGAKLRSGSCGGVRAACPNRKAAGEFRPTRARRKSSNIPRAAVLPGTLRGEPVRPLQARATSR